MSKPAEGPVGKANRRAINEQFDLFLPYIVDLPLRDQREMMERPFFSLSKRKRLTPIHYVSPDGAVTVTVEPHQKYGMPTIWDADLLIWAASTLNDMKKRGVNDIPRRLTARPYELLKAIGEPAPPSRRTIRNATSPRMAKMANNGRYLSRNPGPSAAS